MAGVPIMEPISKPVKSINKRNKRWEPVKVLEMGTQSNTKDGVGNVHGHDVINVVDDPIQNLGGGNNKEPSVKGGTISAHSNDSDVVVPSVEKGLIAQDVQGDGILNVNIIEQASQPDINVNDIG